MGELVARERAVDRFVAEWSACQEGLLAYARETLAFPDDAEDTVQDAAVEAFELLESSCAGTCVRGVAAGFERRVRSANRRLRPRTFGLRAGDRPGDSSDVVELLERETLETALGSPERIRGALSDSSVQGLQALSEDERAPFLLRAVTGRTYDEIAATLDVPVTTVRARIHAARKKLVERLGPRLPRSPTRAAPR